MRPRDWLTFLVLAGLLVCLGVMLLLLRMTVITN